MSGTGDQTVHVQAGSVLARACAQIGGEDAAGGIHARLRGMIADLAQDSAATLTWPEGTPPEVEIADPGAPAPRRILASFPLGPEHTLDLSAPRFFVALDAQGLECGLLARACDEAIREHRVQRMLKRRVPEIFAEVRRVLKKPARRGQKGARWSLRWRPEFEAARPVTSDVNQWLARHAIREAQQPLTLGCLIRAQDLATFDPLAVTQAALAALHPLISPRVAPRDAEGDTPAASPGLGSALRRDAGTAPATALVARLLGAAPGLVPLAQQDSDGAVWVWLDDGQCGGGAHPGYCGLRFDGRARTVELTLYQGIGYAVSRFGGRGSVAQMQRRRASLLPAFEALQREGFTFDSRLHELGTTAHHVQHEAALTGVRRIDGTAEGAQDLLEQGLAALLAARAQVRDRVSRF